MSAIPSSMPRASIFLPKIRPVRYAAGRLLRLKVNPKFLSSRELTVRRVLSPFCSAITSCRVVLALLFLTTTRGFFESISLYLT